MWSLILLALFNIATAVPTRRNSTACVSAGFNEPWILSDIAVYTPEEGATGQQGYISFHFCDVNEGLQLDTNCSGPMINGACDGGDGGYVSCGNNTVAFKFDANQMMWVERVYIDDW